MDMIVLGIEIAVGLAIGFVLVQLAPALFVALCLILKVIFDYFCDLLKPKKKYKRETLVKSKRRPKP